MGAATLAPVRTLAQAAAGTPPDPALRLHAIAVDVGPLIDHGGGAPARAFAPILQRQLQKVFADRLASGAAKGPLLTARITNLYFGEYVERTVDFGFGNNDNIEGDGIVSAGGRVVSTTHVLTELAPSYSGPPILPGIDQLRLDSIAYQFAYWLRREMGL